MIAKTRHWLPMLCALALASGAMAQEPPLGEASPVSPPSEGAKTPSHFVVVRPRAKSKPKPKKASQSNYALARDLERALGIDAQGKTLMAQRSANLAVHATVDSLTPGSPYVAGSLRAPGGGSTWNSVNRTGRGGNDREIEVEAGMPLWLPGQRDALRETVNMTTQEFDARLALRRLEVAGFVREAWWTAQRTAREAAIARERVDSAKDLQRDMERRNELGESAGLEALAARNETLAAETERVQAETADEAAQLAYQTLTGGARAEGVLEAPAKGSILEHPALAAPRATLERADSQLALARATMIDNPELGVFGRNDTVWQGDERTRMSTVGVRFRMQIPTEGRNAPRIAQAQAEIAKSAAELSSAQRLVAAAVANARIALEGAKKANLTATERLKVAQEQYELARKSFSLGEGDATEVFRSRQLMIEAQKIKAATDIGVGLAQSRLNQARGFAPGA